MEFEHKKQPLASKATYRHRLLRYSLFAAGLVIFSLLMGTVGYWYFGQHNAPSTRLSWVDAFLCASMILTGMGPIGIIETDGGKIFSALYALYSGIAFLSSAALFISPILHRFLHLIHVDIKDK